MIIMNTKHCIEITQNASTPLVCSKTMAMSVLNAVLAHENMTEQTYEVHIQTLNPDDIHGLNHQTRQKDRPTNVLSFPYPQKSSVNPQFLGDIVLCPGIIELEAKKQGKTIAQHTIHLLVHSLLHLLGYDHEDHEQAVHMEDKEKIILTTLQQPNPYKD
jgi:probable rRNA maturation factor